MNWRPTASLSTMQARARLYQRIRAFFADRDCLEVDTPLLSRTTSTDRNIGSIAAQNEGKRLYLQTSPEFAMKRLLAAGSGSIYQICHAFREAECGRRHNSEFTLLEWYRVGWDYRRLMDEIEQLIDRLSNQQNEYSRISYADLFLRYVDVDIHTTGIEQLRRQCRARVPGTDMERLDFDQCLDLLLAAIIQPELKGYWFVFDYPSSQASLARLKKHDSNVAERFELFYDGLELANGFSELTDADEQRKRFEDDNELRRREGLPVFPVDELLLAAIEEGLPQCAGVALGIDRLLMALQQLESIDQVLTFVD